MTKRLSVIIPLYNDDKIYSVVRGFEKQTAKPDLFELIIVNDGGKKYHLVSDKIDINYIELESNSGPSVARNVGAKNATGEYLLFVGSDCVPDTNLVFRYLYNFAVFQSDIIQGYTNHIGHDDLFHEFLNVIGLQANYKALKDKNGNWLHQINSSFCLTTNYAIRKQSFFNTGCFNETFKAAAWEDIEFGIRCSQQQLTAMFDPGAVVTHNHPYDIVSFMKRCRKEGFWRINLCLIHPEVCSGLISLDEIHKEKQQPTDVDAMLFEANVIRFSRIEKIKEILFNLWLGLCQKSSLYGVLKGLNDNEILRFTHHATNNTQLEYIFSIASAYLRGDYAYGAHNLEWLKQTDREAEWIHELDLVYSNIVYSLQ